MKKVLKIAIEGAKKYIFGILICSLISSFLMIYLTKFISFAVDGVIMQTSSLPEYIRNSFYSDNVKSKLTVLAIYMLIIVGIISISNYMKSMFNTKFKLTMNKNLKSKLLEHTTYLEYGDYIQYEKNQILQRVSSDANYFVDFVTSKYNLIVDSIFILLFSMYELLNINIIVSSIIGIIIVIISIMSVVYLKITKPIVNKNIDLHENLISRTMNAVYNPKMIKIFNREQKEINDFNIISDEYRKNDTKLIDYLIYYELIGTGMRKFKDPAIFLIGGLLIINGKMNIGELMILMTYSSNLLEYVVQLIYMINDINHFLVPTDRISKFLKLEEEHKNEKQYELDNISLEFKEVTIKINSTKILDNISFKIEKGETIYLVGNNGSGKSILVKTLLGFIPYDGQILLGGIDIKELNRNTIRNYIGVVFQEPFIFSDTIKNNIDVLEDYKNLEKIKNIAKICELDEEIEKFPNQYNEILGERGINLSGGQKQRIAIARTLLQNKEIIVFDDVLSKVDNITKDKIKNNLRKNNKDMIAIYITQDLSKIPSNATVFFIDNKKIVIDKQENLINQNKNYYRLIDICKNMVGEIDE
ncbi:MAG TPA: ABC transporter ATP-binding protein/permease [Clostridiaceae bacterium]|jgi:hypothetical protein|nr:ABC transporter ATP-binding protein/permease [Clostridiaceae bacterium]